MENSHQEAVSSSVTKGDYSHQAKLISADYSHLIVLWGFKGRGRERSNIVLNAILIQMLLLNVCFCDYTNRLPQQLKGGRGQ